VLELDGIVARSSLSEWMSAWTDTSEKGCLGGERLSFGGGALVGDFGVLEILF